MLEGTTENVTGSGSGPSTGAASSGNISSGTASEAMIKAATAASSAAADPAAKPGDTAVVSGGAATSTTTAGATDQLKPQAGSDAPAVAKGPVPFERHEASVKNARAEGRAEGEKQYEWAKGYKAEDVRNAMGWLSDIRSGRERATAFYHQLGQELGLSTAQPATGATGQPAAGGEDEKLPSGSLKSEDGRRAYSEEDMTKVLEVHGRNLMRQFETRFKPVNEFVTTERQSRQDAEITQRTERTAKEIIEDMEARPYFKEHKAAIAEKFQAIPMDVKQRIGFPAAMLRAYNDVLAERVYPSIDQAAEERVKAANAKKAAATRGSAHPSDQGGEGQKPKLRNQAELAAHMRSLEAQAQV